MPRPHLFGPVTAADADRNLRTSRRAGRCLTFGLGPGVDLTLAAADTWADLLARLPDGWRPDFIALDLHYTRVPPAVWEAPIPLVGLAHDWNLLGSYLRLALPRCDLILTDSPGVEILARHGITHARPANLYGLGHDFLDTSPPAGNRPIDILFVGNLHPAVQRERLAWLARIARLTSRRRVAVRTGAFGDDYRRLLSSARVVFNRSVRGECNCRTFEAIWAGALLFQEADNREVPGLLRDREECVLYTEDNLEELLEHYLNREDERRRIAENARSRLREFGFEALWTAALREVENTWPEVCERAERRSRARVMAGPQDENAHLPGLLTAWEAISAAAPVHTDDLRGLQQAAEREGSAQLHNAVGVLTGPRGIEPTAPAQAATALPHFERACAADPGHLIARLNRVEALLGIGQDSRAVEEARRLLPLAEIDEESPGHWLDAPHFPPAFDYFRVEWERAGWEGNGDRRAEAAAKRVLLRWRLHLVLADLTGELSHYEEAARLRPDLPLSHAALGCALARAGRFADAATALTRALRGNPFDLPAAQALGEALRLSGNQAAAEELAADRRLLSAAAPQAVPPEPWFAPAPAAARTHAPVAAPRSLRVEPLSREEFTRRFGAPDTARALCGFTPPHDAHVVLALLAHANARRVLEIGTALGQMTANLSEWSAADAIVFSVGTLDGLPATGDPRQLHETPPRDAFGRFAGHFGKGSKVRLIAADSLRYDFSQLAPLDFAFIDGAHDFEHVLSDSRKVYDALRLGGWLLWHDFGSRAPWVQVREALEAFAPRETVYHVGDTAVAFIQKAGASAPDVCPAPRASAVQENSAPLTVVWHGDVAALHSLAVVNRALCAALVQRGHHVSVHPRAFPDNLRVPALPEHPLLRGRVGLRLPHPADAHVRHSWPPDFTPPPEGHWVVIQPWEFGSLPRAWVGPLREQVDEVWCYTRAVRDCYLAAGVGPERAHVVPLGVDVDLFRPGAPPLPLQTTRRFRFLFVGGTIPRKGFDLLLEAYGRAFTDRDDVCLVVKDMGVGTFYEGQTSEALIARFRERPGAPEVEYLDRPLSDEQLAGLYAACDCLALPYRGEGFGLPVAESMACGLPVVVTGLGAALDYCDESTAFLVPARVAYLPEDRVGDWETVGRPWLAEPDLDALTAALRRVVDDPRAARARGAAGCARIRGSFTWVHSVAAIEARLRDLRRRPVRRFARATLAAPLPIPAPAPSPPSAPAPTAVAPASASVRRVRVCLSMIVRNEEHNLPDCLRSVRDLVDDVVVVDTGSTDRTKEIAAEFGTRVYDFPWVDSFAAARNEALKHAEGEWVFWMDADDRLDEDNQRRLAALFDTLGEDNAAYGMKCLCLAGDGAPATVVDHVRLFRNRPDLRWRYRVHEQILPGVRATGGEVRFTDVVIQHTGYRDAAVRRRKMDRDLRLLTQELAESPEEPFVLFNLGMVYQEQGRFPDALDALRRSLRASHPADSIVRKLYALVAQCERQLGRPDQALRACEEGRGHYPDDAEVLFQEALARKDLGDRAGARTCLERLLAGNDGPHFASVGVGLRGYQGRHNLAVLCHEDGDLTAAEEHWRAALAEAPRFASAWLGLGEILLTRTRWSELEDVVFQMAQAGAAVEADVLRARAALARKDFAEARSLLLGAIAQAPRALFPRVILTHALLQEGTDWAAAERALRDVLELEPNHAESRRNLEVLLRQQGRSAEM